MDDPREDDALVTAAASGDEEAFRVLVERWERRVQAFFYRSLGSREDAADLAQETFIRLHRAAPRYIGRGRFAAFLFRIAGNLARNEIRKSSIRRFLSFGGGSGPDDPSPDAFLDRLEGPEAARPDEAFRRAEEAARVQRAILALPERQRTALVLKRFEGMSQKEIAEAMGVSESAAESLVIRAMKALRRSLGGP
jgi:RNA polymerase sigma-70 factor (ECF subfamily)